MPASAILHLHDRDWVYLPGGGKSFKRAEVVGGITLPDNTQVVAGIRPGDKVVKNALVLEEFRWSNAIRGLSRFRPE